MNKLRIFVSSVQKELAGERRAVKDFIFMGFVFGHLSDIPDINWTNRTFEFA